MKQARTLIGLVVVGLVAGGLLPAVPAGAKGRRGPLPPPVEVRQEPEVALADPAFTALPGATADYGRLGGSVYRIEMPAQWNGRLVLYMHGFENFDAEASTTAPDFRRWLIEHGYAWGASSFSTTSQIPVRSADETAALWDFFVEKYAVPARSYVSGLSMGGAASLVAATRYGNRFDGALGMCGAARAAPSPTGPGADFFVVGAYLAGLTQADYEGGEISALIHSRILPVLEDPEKHRQFEQIMVDLTGGARAFGPEGVHAEEETNWERAEQLVLVHAARNRPHYDLSAASGVSERDFNRRAIRYDVDEESYASLMEATPPSGDLQMPLLTMHTTGDGQVPIEQAQITRRLVSDAGRAGRLVQRVFRDAGHCGFTTEEQEEAFAALVGWVERGKKPRGTDLGARDLRQARPTFDRNPRPGTAAADRVPGARERIALHGRATLDGEPFDARFLGAVVQRPDGLSAACQYDLAPVVNGRYRITVLADREARGCGGPGARVTLWTFVDGEQLASTRAAPWPDNGRTARFDAAFSSADPAGAAPETVAFAGEAYLADGTHLPPGTRVAAFVGDTRCGLASLRRTGSFGGFVLAVAGPDAVPGCTAGAPVAFRVGGRWAVETAVNAERDDRELLELTVPARPVR